VSDAPTVRLAYNPGPINAYRALDAPAVRLAYHPEGGRTLSEFQASTPAVRLAYGNSPPERNGTSGLEAPSVRLATCLKSQTGANSAEHAAQTFVADNTDRPALLVSFVYLQPFLKNRHRYHYRDWVMDSGAFSAHASGKDIDHQQYLDTCKELMAADPTLTEVFALDVIGDWRASLKNTEEAWRQGVPVIPTFHVGEPEDVLKALARDYPKIALGGAVGYRGKDKWAEQCFARVWPARVHGLGFGSEKSILALPWHSVDATNWEIGPCAFGRWQSFGKMSVRGSKQNLRAEVEFYLKLEQRARVKWRKQMAELAALPKPWPQTVSPAVRLAVAGSDTENRDRYAVALDAPTVRLVAGGNAGREDVKAEAFARGGK
jgi:hypothetical protein